MDAKKIVRIVPTAASGGGALDLVLTVMNVVPIWLGSLIYVLLCLPLAYGVETFSRTQRVTQKDQIAQPTNAFGNNFPRIFTSICCVAYLFFGITIFGASFYERKLSGLKADLADATAGEQRLEANKLLAEEKLSGWKFSSPLYSALPGDVEFISRNHSIRKNTGASLRVELPESGDYFVIEMSSFKKTSQTTGPRPSAVYTATLSMSGVVDGNEIRKSGERFSNENVATFINPQGEELVELKPGSLIHLGTAGSHNFFLFVDDDHPDSFSVSIAATKLKWLQMKNINLELGSIRIHDKCDILPENAEKRLKECKDRPRILIEAPE